MNQAILKQSFAWAVVTKAGTLALFSGQCPIFWKRAVAQAFCDQHTRRSNTNMVFHVEKVTVLAVSR